MISTVEFKMYSIQSGPTGLYNPIPGLPGIWGYGVRSFIGMLKVHTAQLAKAKAEYNSRILNNYYYYYTLLTASFPGHLGKPTPER